MVALLSRNFRRSGTARLPDRRTHHHCRAVLAGLPRHYRSSRMERRSIRRQDSDSHRRKHHINERTRQIFAHELVHACLSNLGTWPAWLHEGFAQKLSGETLTPTMRNNLRALMRAEKVPRLENMSQSWSRLSANMRQRPTRWRMQPPT